MMPNEVEDVLKDIQAGAKLRLRFGKQHSHEILKLHAMTNFGGLSIEHPMTREALRQIGVTGSWNDESNRTMEVVVRAEFFTKSSSPPDLTNQEKFVWSLSHALEAIEVVV